MEQDVSRDRRRLLATAMTLGGLGLSGCASTPRKAAATPAPPGPPDRARALAPLLARTDRIFDITVCLRPFRAAGPRLEVERVGEARVVHNYGHGGSGWSLSWGSSTLAVRKALEGSTGPIAVVGCGALGLTSALLAQAAGRRVTIYARELIHDTMSIRATGTWSPDSRIALADAVAPGFPALWEEMARTSLKAWRRELGLPGDPVRWVDHYYVADAPPVPRQPQPGELHFAAYGDRLRDAFPRNEFLEPADTPFTGAILVRRQSGMVYNLSAYAHALLARFRAAGGHFEHREFREPAELGRLPEKVVIHCTGYGARALWRDESIVPVRGQLAWLIPQPEFDYGLLYRGVSVTPRGDGIGVQAVGGGDTQGYGEDDLAPRREESDEAVRTLAALYARFGRAGSSRQHYG